MTTFALVEAMGVRVIEVEALPEKILYIRAYQIALVDADLNDDEREEVADLLFASIAGAADD